MSLSDDAVPIRKLDDITLIQKYVEGEAALLSNQNLRVESTFDAVQLLAKREGVIATTKADQKSLISLRRASQYWDLLHQTLIEHYFAPIDNPDAQGFVTYRKYDIPDGYEFHCAEARLLWKEWWLRKRKYNSQAIQLDLLIFVRDKWYPIRDVISTEGTLFITTLVGDTILQGSEQVIWLSRSGKAAEQKLSQNHFQSKRPPAVENVASPPRPPFEPSSPTQPLESTWVPNRQAIPGSARRQTPPIPPPVIQEPSPPVEVPPKFEFDELEIISPEDLFEQAQPFTFDFDADEVTKIAEPEESSSFQPEASSYLGQEAEPAAVESFSFDDITSVLRFERGRLYVSTAIGEIVIEGSDLTFWLTRRE